MVVNQKKKKLIEISWKLFAQSPALWTFSCNCPLQKYICQRIFFLITGDPKLELLFVHFPPARETRFWKTRVKSTIRAHAAQNRGETETRCVRTSQSTSNVPVNYLSRHLCAERRRIASARHKSVRAAYYSHVWPAVPGNSRFSFPPVPVPSLTATWLLFFLFFIPPPVLPHVARYTIHSQSFDGFVATFASGFGLFGNLEG